MFGLGIAEILIMMAVLFCCILFLGAGVVAIVVVTTKISNKQLEGEIDECPNCNAKLKLKQK
jgi:hypothetical protein